MLCQLPLFNDVYAVYCTRGESTKRESTKGAKQLGGETSNGDETNSGDEMSWGETTRGGNGTQ